ncbi:hypothetical protein BKA57DRAFT_49767 [Linnemannia elongata]|nr:hypothetical protein BKA57DRAFT_49767 [Linnemannia elongata]
MMSMCVSMFLFIRLSFHLPLSRVSDTHKTILAPSTNESYERNTHCSYCFHLFFPPPFGVGEEVIIQGQGSVWFRATIIILPQVPPSFASALFFFSFLSSPFLSLYPFFSVSLSLSPL